MASVLKELGLLCELGSYKFPSENYFLINRKKKKKKLGGKGGSCHPLPFCLLPEFFKTE